MKLKCLLLGLCLSFIFATSVFAETKKVVVTTSEQAALDAVSGPAFATVPKEAVTPETNTGKKLIGNFKITAYTKEEFPNSKTASGVYPTVNHTVAADWKVIPKGSKIMIGDNPTVYTVEDTGAKGMHLDIFLETNAEAIQHGVRYADVYLIE